MIGKNKKLEIEREIANVLAEHNLNYSTAMGYYIVSTHIEDYDVIDLNNENSEETIEVITFDFANIRIECFELKGKKFLFSIEYQVLNEEEDKNKKRKKFIKEHTTRIYNDILQGFKDIVEDYSETIIDYKNNSNIN